MRLQVQNSIFNIALINFDLSHWYRNQYRGQMTMAVPKFGFSTADYSFVIKVKLKSYSFKFFSDYAPAETQKRRLHNISLCFFYL